MADVPTVSDSGVIELIETVVSPGKGGIEVIALGDDSQHPAPCGEQFAGAVAAGAGMKQLMVGAGGEVDVGDCRLWHSASLMRPSRPKYKLHMVYWSPATMVEVFCGWLL